MSEIQSFASTSKSYILSIDNTTYIAYVDANDDYSYDTLGTVKYDDKLLNNLCPLSSISFQGLAARQHRYPYKSEDDYQYSYTPLNTPEMINFIEVNDTIYSLRDKSTLGHCYINDTLFDWLARDNGYNFPIPHQILTYLYKLQPDKHVESKVSGVICDVEYNSIYEIPGNLKNNYESGSLFATTIKTKNQYDAYYDMKGSNGTLSNCRKYTGIHKCNNQLYLTYEDDLKYIKPSSDTITVPSVDIYGNQVSANTFTKYDTTISTCYSTCNYPLIEVIENINRGISQIPHKSSLYSLRLETEFMKNLEFKSEPNENNTNNIDSIKDTLRQEIKNCIRQFAEKLAPANSLLFSVTVT